MILTYVLVGLVGVALIAGQAWSYKDPTTTWSRAILIALSSFGTGVAIALTVAGIVLSLAWQVPIWDAWVEMFGR